MLALETGPAKIVDAEQGRVLSTTAASWTSFSGCPETLLLCAIREFISNLTGA